MIFIGRIFHINSIMGSGKTSAAINYINSHPDEKFIVITPFLSEIERFVSACPMLKFRVPSNEKVNCKSASFKFLIKNRKNIVTTHQLLFLQNTDIIEYLNDYNLMCDEAFNCAIKEFNKYWPFEKKMIMDTCFTLEEDGTLVWKQNKNYNGTLFKELKNLSDQGRLKGFHTGDNYGIFEVFPSEILLAFKNVFVLTFLFEYQYFYYYLKSEKIETEPLYVMEDSGNYYFTDIEPERKPMDIDKLIHIHYGKITPSFPNGKINAIGDNPFSLSKNWYKTRGDLEKLQKDLDNYLTNIVKTPARKVMWTTYKEFKTKLCGKRHRRNYVSCNAKATNDFSGRTTLAYLVNLFMSPSIVMYFNSFGINVSQNGFTLSETVQWIWRGAIRDGKEIDLYIPSSRTRNLVVAFIDYVCGKTDKIVGIDAVLDLNSTEIEDETNIYEDENIETYVVDIDNFGDYADEEKSIIPCEKISNKAIPSFAQVS